jgi:hypothetical protein
VDNIRALPVEGSAPEWLKAFQGLTLQPNESSVVLRDPMPDQKIKFTWTDVAGTVYCRRG